jgi:hypothetical protein
MTVLQQAPEPDRRAAPYTGVYSTSAGGGGTPPDNRVGPLEIQLNNDGRLKTSLHRLVLVLPLTILIFAEALRHQNEKIKLPLLELEIQIRLVIPIFLMLICYMLYRAIRYSRIVISSVFSLPEQTNKIAQIVLDNTEAYKVSCAYYEEVLDPMAAEFVDASKNNQSKLIRYFNSKALPALNLTKSLVVYGLIFLMLSFMILYVSKELVSAATALKTEIFKLRWLSEPTTAIDALILGISALLLLLAWSNAALAALLAFLVVAGIAFFGVAKADSDHIET